MEIQMRRAMIFDDTLNDLCRRTEPQPVDAKTLISILEKEGADGSPVILFVAGTRPEKPGRFDLREVRRLLVYESKEFLKVEKNRLEEEKKVALQAVRQAKLDEIKNRLRSRLEADDANFNKRYDAQSRERAEIVEAEIEREALMILEKEEQE